MSRLGSIDRWLERTGRLLHALVAAASVGLIVTSPLISMRRIVPDNPGIMDLAHLGVGLALVPLALAYLATNVIGGRWRRYFPWLAGKFDEPGSDLSGIARGRIPSAGGSGLFATIEGLLLVMLVLTAFTGLGWLAADGARIALTWWHWHIVSANVFGWLLVVHVIAVALHLVEFLRD